jgi:hypothetical protein
MSEHTSHYLQFAGSDDERLVRNVGRYIVDGLERNQRCIVIATAPHLAAFAAYIETLGVALVNEQRSGRLAMLDAAEVARDLMEGGMPGAQAFGEIVAARVRTMDKRYRGLRAYGEIVGVYWSQGERQAAVRLEQMWNDLMRDVDFSLYCGYGIDIFDRGFTADNVDALMCSHAEVVSGVDAERLRAALDNAMDTILSDRAQVVRDVMARQMRPGWGNVPQAEGAILWLRNNLRAYADEILRLTRASYQCAMASGSSPRIG